MSAQRTEGGAVERYLSGTGYAPGNSGHGAVCAMRATGAASFATAVVLFLTAALLVWSCLDRVTVEYLARDVRDSAVFPQQRSSVDYGYMVTVPAKGLSLPAARILGVAVPVLLSGLGLVLCGIGVQQARRRSQHSQSQPA